jgi:hypothetical protein
MTDTDPATCADFTVRAVRMTRLVGRPDESVRSDGRPLASEAAESFGAAAEIALIYAIRYGYPEELLLSQMDWAEECCTGQGPAGSPPAYSFGSPSLVGNPVSWVAISIESAEYTRYLARIAWEIACKQADVGGL